MRPPHLHHCTSEPYRFFGRSAELRLLDEALSGGAASVVALVGPGGQGKTAVAQHWLESLRAGTHQPDGVFLWSFYRGKDADLCLRELYGYALGADRAPDVAASYCVDHLLPILRRERWAIVLDGTEVAQYDSGSWQGRFLHPELGRLIEELASEPMHGVLLLTTRFALPTLAHRHHARVLGLSALDSASARGLLASLGVKGTEADLEQVATAAGYHAKAVELLGTFLVRFHDSTARCLATLPPLPHTEGASAEELHVARVLAAYQQTLSAEDQDLVALATAFRDPPTEARLLEYLTSAPARTLLHDTWGRAYPPFAERAPGWLAGQVQQLIDLRLLERVGRFGPGSTATVPVIDAHPLVRRGFEHALGPQGQRQHSQARAGFLRGRPDRRRPDTLEEAREEVELFHAYCDAGLWNEADSTYVALDNPKHRFLAPILERDLLLRFFPGGDWRKPPLWPGFGRFRSLAICFEMLGQFDDALDAYREGDAALRGDALLATGRLKPLLDHEQMPSPWQTLWQAYRCHALCLAGRVDAAVALAQSLVPIDIYEWVHVFECLLRAGQLGALDLRSLLFRPPHSSEHRWTELARRRMRADYLRVTGPAADDLGSEYQQLLDAYDRGGLPYERTLTRLSYAAYLLHREERAAQAVATAARELARQHGMRILQADACLLLGSEEARAEAQTLRQEVGFAGQARR